MRPDRRAGAGGPRRDGHEVRSLRGPRRPGAGRRVRRPGRRCRTPARRARRAHRRPSSAQRAARRGDAGRRLPARAGPDPLLSVGQPQRDARLRERRVPSQHGRGRAPGHHRRRRHGAGRHPLDDGRRDRRRARTVALPRGHHATRLEPQAHPGRGHQAVAGGAHAGPGGRGLRRPRRLPRATADQLRVLHLVAARRSAASCSTPRSASPDTAVRSSSTRCRSPAPRLR